MKKRICNRIEIASIFDIESIINNNISLKPGKSFYNIPLEGKGSYSSQRQNPDGGSIINETLTAKTREDSYILTSPLKYYVVKIYTTDSYILMGSLDYPAELTYTSNEDIVNLTFKASKEL